MLLFVENGAVEKQLLSRGVVDAKMKADSKRDSAPDAAGSCRVDIACVLVM